MKHYPGDIQMHNSQIPVPNQTDQELKDEAYRRWVLTCGSADNRQVGGSLYNEMEYQPWHCMEDLLTREEFIGYLKGSLIGYAMRQGRKPGSDDAAKARHYADKLREVQG